MYQFKLTVTILIQISEDIYAVVNERPVNLPHYKYLYIYINVGNIY